MEQTTKVAAEDFDVNEDDLFGDWVKQSTLVFHYGRELAKARKRSKRQTAAIKLYSAKLSLKIRMNYGDHGLSRLTEDGVKAVLAMDETLIEMQDGLVQAEYEVDVLEEAAMKSLLDKRKALENLVQMELEDYRSQREPRAKNQEQRDKLHDIKKDMTRSKVKMERREKDA